MRAPRYRFPNEVRSTTREIADRMVREGTVAHTPEQLEAWISERPEVREVLERGGYGREFTAHDLFPLLEVFVAKAGGGPAPADAPPRSSRNRWLLGVAILVGVLLLAALAAGLFARTP